MGLQGAFRNAAAGEGQEGGSAGAGAGAGGNVGVGSGSGGAVASLSWLRQPSASVSAIASPLAPDMSHWATTEPTEAEMAQYR